jgi:hypothetical protein
MKLRPRLKAGAFLACVAVAAAGLLAAPAAAAAGGPEDAAAAYLQARAAAITSRQPAIVLAPHVVAGSALAARETFVARGTALRQADLGHAIDEVTCGVDVRSSTVSGDGATASVAAHAVTTILWHARGGSSIEASGVDHQLTLVLVDGVWKVTADQSNDVEVPADLERAGVPAPAVRAASRRVEARAMLREQLLAPDVLPDAPVAADGQASPTAKTYTDRLVYDRDAAMAYADRYALNYNATYARFSGDCCNFVSQGARAGGMPPALGDWTSGWWYDKEGTSSPSDDSYSWSWISCSRQIAFWLGTRIDWVSSISNVARGDVIYYDWSGDGSWDHVAILAGTNSAGQKVIDAHTTDHYHAYWKLGTASTRYKFGRVRASWVV